MSGINKRRFESTGQALVEFALIILILAFLIFVIIEGARILQADLTAQNAARAAGRYAVTGQFDASCLADSPPCTDPRVESIKEVARQELAGLPLANGAAYADPNYYLIEVIGTDEDGNQVPDFAGIPGGPVMVRVTYRVGMVTPLTRPIAETVRVIGQVVMNNERFTQVSNTTGSDDAPVLTPFPTPGPSPTPPPPDLEVSKQASVDPAVVDVSFIYTINVVNLAPTDAIDVQLVDELPANFTYMGSPTHDAKCSATPPTVACELGDIPGDSGVTVELEVRASSPATDVTNTAQVNYPGDTNTSNNVGEDTIDVIEPPSNTTIDVSKGASATVVAIDGELVYSISVVNTGVASAENVQISDDIPASMTILGAPDPSQGSCSVSGNSVTCALGEIPRNGSATVSIRVQAGQQGTFTNTVNADAANADPDQDSVPVDVQDIADLGVTKSASQNPGVGEQMSYFVDVVNNGPADASGVTMQDSLPPSVNFISATPSQGTCSEAGNVVECQLGAIDDGAGATIEIMVEPDEDGPVTNNVAIFGAEEDPYAPNDTFILDTVIQPRADLAITKSGPDEIRAGAAFKYDITVENLGPSRAQGVTVQDELPPDVTFVTAATTNGTDGTCSGTNSLVTCNLGTLPAGAVATLEIWIIPRSAPEEGDNGEFGVINVAQVSSGTIDPDLSNNRSDSVFTEVDVSQAFIALDKICGLPGTEFTVSGGGVDWSKPSGQNLVIDWIPDQGPIIELYSGTGTLPQPVTVPQVTITDPANPENYTIRATRQNKVATAEFSVPCPAPNLIISTPQLTGETPIVAGETVTFTAEVSNIGNRDAISQFFAGLYFDPSPAPIGSDTHIDQSYRQTVVALNGLAQGASKTVTFTVEAGFSTAGTHEVYGVADSDPAEVGQIKDEHDETDNISSALQVTVDPAFTPTPTASPTAGSTATPTATPTPGPTVEPGSLFVSVQNEDAQPQGSAEVTVIDEDSGEPVATGYTDIFGNHLFESLQPGTYTVTACITIENDDFFAFVTGVLIEPGAVAQRILFLEPAPGGCT